MTWYIAENGQPTEIREEVLIYKIQSHGISPDTLVVNEQINNWVHLKETQLYKQYASRRIDEESVAAFVGGKNRSYYVMKWKAMQETGNKVSWNWSSFLFSTYWMLYRKMYVPAIIKLVIDGILTYIGTLGSVISLGLWVMCGLFGNYLYFQQMEKTIAEANTLGEIRRSIYLSKKGGTTFVPVVIIGLLYVVFFVFIIMGVAALYPYYTYR